jgi:hypothetical protein
MFKIIIVQILLLQGLSEKHTVNDSLVISRTSFGANTETFELNSGDHQISLPVKWYKVRERGFTGLVADTEYSAIIDVTQNYMVISLSRKGYRHIKLEYHLKYIYFGAR